MIRIILFLGLVALATTSCNKEKKQAKKDKKTIEKYLSDKGIKAESTSTGLYFVIESQGTGDYPTINSTVKVAYTGYLTNGQIFDQSDVAGISFPLTSVIEGWQQGIPLFKEGGKGKLFIPSALGYGNRKVGDIPANSVLIFDIHLIDVL